MAVQIIGLALGVERGEWILTIVRRQDLNLERREAQNWLDGGAMD